MKKIVFIMALFASVMLMSGCQKSNIVIEESPEIEGLVLEDPNRPTEPVSTVPTTAYTIPEGATGPADITLGPDAYAGYTEDKKPQETEGIIQVQYYYINSKGISPDFDVLENKECNAGNLNELLINTGVLVDGTEVVGFESDGTNATLTLNKLEGQSSYATEELLAQALANTYTENLGLDYLTIIVDGQTYGPLDFKKK